MRAEMGSEYSTESRDRIAHFRHQAARAEQKALSAAMSMETRRAWLIVSREWNKMAEREELKYLDTSTAHLAPEDAPTAKFEPEEAAATKLVPEDTAAAQLEPDDASSAKLVPKKDDGDLAIGDLEDAIRKLAAQNVGG